MILRRVSPCRLTMWVLILLCAGKVHSQDYSEQDEIACHPDRRPAIITNNDGWLASPGFPEKYPNYLDCHWLIRSSLKGYNETVSIIFTYFLTERNNDYVILYDGGKTSAPLLAELHGWPDINETIFNSTTGELLVQFHTDYITVPFRNGFNLTYTVHSSDISIATAETTVADVILTDQSYTQEDSSRSTTTLAGHESYTQEDSSRSMTTLAGHASYTQEVSSRSTTTPAGLGQATKTTSHLAMSMFVAFALVIMNHGNPTV